MDFIRRTWAEIDMSALDHNINRIKSIMSPGQKLMGIVKADGYGHGDTFVARRLQESGYDWLGISSIETAVRLRKEGITIPILVLGYTPMHTVNIMEKYNVTQTVISMEFAEALQREAHKANCRIDVHIKLDTGMCRIGFQTDDINFDESLENIIEVSKMPNLHITGIFSHHAVADAYEDDHPAFTKMQVERFHKMVAALQANGVDVGLRHVANSATTIAYLEKHMDMCRTGNIMYGMLPSDECHGMIDLQPLMTLKTAVALVKTVQEGDQLSYGRTYTAPGERRIATLPVGYADGFSRALSNRGRVLVHGQFAPIVGRICMDQLMVDVTDIPDVRMGDEVVLFGRQGDTVLPVEEVAGLLGTINYEITCGITKRIPRVYLQDGEIIGIADNVWHQYK